MYSQTYEQEQVQRRFTERTLILRLLTYLKPYRLWIGVGILLMIVAKGIDAFVPILIGQISGQILINYPDVADTLAAFDGVVKACLAMILLICLSYLAEAINVLIKSWVGQKALYTLRTQIFQHIQKLPVAYYDHHTVGRLITRTVHDVDQISQMFSDGVVPILGNIILFLGILVGIFILDWRVGLAVCAVLPLVWKLTHDFRLNQRRCYEMIRSIVSAINTFAQEHLLGMSTVRHFGLQKREKEKFEELNSDHCTANLESMHNFSFFIAGIDFLQSLSLVIVFVMLVMTASPDTGFQAGMYITFGLYVPMFFRPLGDLAERYNVLQSAMSAAQRIFNILDEPIEPQGVPSAKIQGDIESIVFDDVWFAYEKDNWVLKGVSFEMHKGESVALVGITGSGKTSIISLLLRLYDYQRGTILINGKDIKEYSVASLRHHFSIILQDPVIFSGTIADNVALYDPHIVPDQIESAIDYVHLRSLVNRLPHGINYQLKERGSDLSLGEKQLISLARAIAHQHRILIFDEATANIDSASERKIQEVLAKVLKNKTSLVIAHRLSTIKDVDRILVVHQGKIVEAGSHAELLAIQGIYEKLYRLQYSQM